MRLSSVVACLLLVPALVMADEPEPKPVTPAEAAKKLNEKVTVEMVVKSTGGRENCYLNSEDDFKLDANFTVFISKDAKEKLKKAGIDNPAARSRSHPGEAPRASSAVPGSAAPEA